MRSEQELQIILESIRNDVDQVGHQLKDISMKVIEEGISSFPIYIASHEHHQIGKPIFDPDSSTLNWTFHASIIEEFIQKDIIPKDRVNAFQKAYEDPETRACIFILDSDLMQIVFIPYELTQEDVQEASSE